MLIKTKSVCLLVLGRWRLLLASEFTDAEENQPADQNGAGKECAGAETA